MATTTPITMAAPSTETSTIHQTLLFFLLEVELESFPGPAGALGCSLRTGLGIEAIGSTAGLLSWEGVRVLSSVGAGLVGDFVAVGSSRPGVGEIEGLEAGSKIWSSVGVKAGAVVGVGSGMGGRF